MGSLSNTEVAMAAARGMMAAGASQDEVSNALRKLDGCGYEWTFSFDKLDGHLSIIGTLDNNDHT